MTEQLKKFYNHPITQRIRRSHVVSIQVAKTRPCTEEQDKMAKLHCYEAALAMEMERNPEYRDVVIEAAMSKICEILVSSTNYEQKVELTPKEELGYAIARMIIDNIK